MLLLRKTLSSLAIRVVSALAGFAVSLNDLINLEVIVVIFTVITAAVLVFTVYSRKVKRIFPYLLIIKSGFDSIYILSLNSSNLAVGLIVSVNTLFAMIIFCDYVLSSMMANRSASRLKSILFSICLLVPYLVVFLSLTLITVLAIFREISVLFLILYLYLGGCILFKVNFIFVNLLLLKKTIKKENI